MKLMLKLMFLCEMGHCGRSSISIFQGFLLVLGGGGGAGVGGLSFSGATEHQPIICEVLKVP